MASPPEKKEKTERGQRTSEEEETVFPREKELLFLPLPSFNGRCCQPGNGMIVHMPLRFRKEGKGGGRKVGSEHAQV